MNLDYSPVLGANGRPEGILAVVVETTQQVVAERASAPVDGLTIAILAEKILGGPLETFSGFPNSIRRRHEAIGMPSGSRT